MNSSQTKTPKIQVIVYSDLACPWCYVGQKRLRAAIERLESCTKHDDTNINHIGNLVDVIWKPYQIDPGTAIDGEEYESYNRRRWGSSGWTNHLRQEGRQDGGALFQNWIWWPNTSRAHQWVQYGATQFGISTDTLNAILFQALYEDGMNISLVDVLVDLGKQHFPSCNGQELHDYLYNNRGGPKVQEEIQHGKRRYNVKSVPFFILTTPTIAAPNENLDQHQQPYTILSGARGSNEFLKVFQEMLK